MKVILINAIAFLFVTSVFAQIPEPANWQKKTPKALGIGDNVPDYTFPSVIQYSKPTLNLSELKGKVIIIDFWFTGCTACIDGFPHMQKLQDKFKDQIQVIAVNDFYTDTWETINKSISRYKKATGYSFTLPVTLYDSTICDYFAHISPCEVIIDPKGKVVAITDSPEITEENIQRILDGKTVAFSLHDDFWNSNIPYVSYFNKNNKDNIFFSSSLIKYRPLPGLAYWGSQYNDKNEFIGMRINFQLITGYREVYPELFIGNPQVKYETENEIFKEYPGNPDSNYLIYDWIVQPGMYNVAEGYKLFINSLRADIDKSFNFSLRRTKVMYPCLIARTNKNISKSYSKGPASKESGNNLFKYKTATRNHIRVSAHNVNINFLDEILGEFNAVKLMDETSLGKKELDIDFPLGIDFSDNAKIAAFLSSRGIDVTVENRELDCIIVSDKKPGEPTVLN